MRAPLIALFVAISIACFTASYVVLPRVKIDDSANGGAQMQNASIPDTLRLPKLENATFERLVLESEVQAGDTLGYLLKDKYRATRDSLSAFAKTGLTELNFKLLPTSIAQELNGLRSSLTDSAIALPTTRTRFALRGKERDYLAAEIMGAEDASTEILGKLSHLNDSGKSESAEAKGLELQLKKKQSFISSANRQLAKQEEFSVPPKQGKERPYPVLTPTQRDRILALSDALPIDTQRVFAPIAGRYYRPDDGVGYIITTPKNTEFRSMPSGLGASRYILEAGGHPVLWGTAQRTDSSGYKQATSGEKLKVIVQ